jgi:DNA/RNA-binding domain of Phe-tRNA-synthetase-like protein
MTQSVAFTVSEAWRNAFPGAFAGALAVREVSNPDRHAGLDDCKRSLESRLRAQFVGKDRAVIRALPTIQAYAAYYKRFDKTYHVQAQLESVALKSKPIPAVAALVEAMFMAELESQLLTAGHEGYVVMRGQPQTLKPGDMFMADRQGVISSILYGPDQRTQITPATTSALFTVYAPAGISEMQVRRHLERLAEYVRVVAPQAVIEPVVVCGA